MIQDINVVENLHCPVCGGPVTIGYSEDTGSWHVSTKCGADKDDSFHCMFTIANTKEKALKEFTRRLEHE